MILMGAQTVIMPDPSKTDMMISVRDLIRVYKTGKLEVIALRGVDLDVEKGEIVAIMGPSGCGKTTLLRVIAGFYHPDDGHVFFDENDVTRLPPHKRETGMVFQNYAIWPHMRVFDNVAFGPRILGQVSGKGELRDLVEQSLESVALLDEIKGPLDQSAMDLSLGEQQRLCLARVLAVKPEIILMDEPCSALDPIATLRIEELMQVLKEQYTIVIVTHNMQQAARVSDKTGLFWLGELVEFGETNQIFTRPNVQRTEDYITGRTG